MFCRQYLECWSHWYALVSKFRKGICFSVCVIDIFRKYTWVILLKDNRGITITINAFQKILDGSNYRPNKIWVDNGSEFYNTSMKFWLQKNDIETYSVHDEEKSFIAERLIETFKNRFTSIWIKYLKICILIN